jgi:hypothetical protein
MGENLVSKELSDSYERLKKKHELYKKATKYGNILKWSGAIIFVLSLFSVIPRILEAYFGIKIDYSFFGGMALGGLLAFIGERINQRTPITFPIEEEEFLNVYESLGDIEIYRKDRIDSRFEAAKKLSKFEKRINEPSWEHSHLWERLTKEDTENLRLLKRNTKEKLLPNITQGNEDDVNKAYIIIEILAKYLLNPTVSELRNLNKSMSELTLYPSEKSRLIPFFGHPYMRHFGSIIFFVFLGFLVFYLGIHVVGVSTDNAYIAGTTLSGALIAGYMVLMVRKS